MTSTRTFLDALFPELGAEESIEVRVIAERKGGDVLRTGFAPSVDDILQKFPTLLDYQKPTNGHSPGAIYFGVAPRVNKVGTKEGVRTLTALWADCDTQESSEKLTSFPVPPSIIVGSGGAPHKRHAYWLLKEREENVELCERTMRGIATYLGADHVHDRGRILRLPGTMNLKDREHPGACEILEFHPERRYSLSDFEAFIAEPEPEREAIDLGDIIDEVPEKFCKLLEAPENKTLLDAWEGRRKPKKDQTRSGYDFMMAELCVRAGLSDSEIASVLLRYPHGKARERTTYYTELTISNARAKLRPEHDGDIPRANVHLQIEDLRAFMSRMKSEPPLDWFVAGLIPDEGSCLWHGQPRDFKSMCAQETSLALVFGRVPFQAQRFAVKRPVKVAYFTNEDNERLFYARMKWLTASTGEEIPSGFFFPFIRRGITFDRKEDRDAILLALVECEAEVAFFDPGRSFSMFFDKGPADFQPVAQFLRQIQNETPVKTPVIIHHDTKPNATPNQNPDRSRSQLASGGGIFSISDCPVSFRKLDWNRCGVFPEDYKLSGDPKPFEVEFQSDSWVDENGADRFGTWIRPVATTKEERSIGASVTREKILNFLQELRKNATEESEAWASTDEITKGAVVRRENAADALDELRKAKLIDLANKERVVQFGRNVRAKLWSIPPAGGRSEFGDGNAVLPGPSGSFREGLFPAVLPSFPPFSGKDCAGKD